MSKNTPALSVVIPAFNEHGNVTPLVEEIREALDQRCNYEIVVVDDASTDDTYREICALADKYPEVRAEQHARNRGQSAAIHTGVEAAAATVIAVLDGDGQNDPADIPALFDKLQATPDANMVVGERRKRNDNVIRKLSSRVANAVRGAMLGDGIRDTGCGLKVFYREDFLKLPAFDHMHRFLPALIQRDGGRVYSVLVNHRPRNHGKSKYGINNRLWVGIVDMFGVMWLKRRRI